MNHFGVTDEQYQRIVEFVIDTVINTEDSDDIPEVLGVSRAKVFLHSVQPKRSGNERLKDFQIMLLRIASRMQMLATCTEMMVKVQLESPEVAQDLIQQFKSILEGGQWGLSLDTMINLYRDQLEVYRQDFFLTEEEQEEDFESEVGRYDPIPREAPDFIRHE